MHLTPLDIVLGLAVLGVLVFAVVRLERTKHRKPSPPIRLRSRR